VFDGINMPGLICFSVCFLFLTYNMMNCDFQTQITILISDVMETHLQFFASVMVKLILYPNTVLSWHIGEGNAA
jgi:hypothetical protein